MTQTAEVIQSGVDYFTATCSTREKVEPFLNETELILYRQRAAGNRIKPQGAQGYQGYKCGSFFIGKRHDGWMVQMSGDVAYTNYLALHDKVSHVARLDAQVTVKLKNEQYALARNVYLQAVRHRQKHKTKLKVYRIEEYAGGYTTYLGSPKSELRARCYNKHAESKDEYYRGCYRYEVQARNDVAGWYNESIGGARSSHAQTAAIVRSYFYERGHKPVYDASSRLSYHSHLAPSDDGRTLVWLSTSVKRPVARLIDSGLLIATLDALGIDRALLDEAVRLHTAQAEKES